jgi:hypothetical protein
MVTFRQSLSTHAVVCAGKSCLRRMVPMLLLVFAGSQATADSNSVNQLSGAVRRLGSGEFDTRREAGDELLKAGESAVPLLRRAASTSDSPEVRYRASELLQRIERQVLELQISDLLAGRPISGELPVWERFSEMVGSDQNARNLLALMLERAPDLMLSIGGADLQEHFDECVNELLNPTFRRSNHPLTIPEAAVLMFAMSQPECQPTQATSVVIVQYINVQNFRTALLSSEHGSPLRMILSAWVTRSEAGPPKTRLMLANAYELPEGRVPALEIVTSPNQGLDVQEALLFLAKYGEPADIKEIERLLENPQQLASARVAQGEMSTEVRDVALAILWKMHGESAARHGMPDYVEVSGRPKPGTIGFTTDQARAKALGEWRAWRKARVKADLPPDGRAVEGQSA